MATPGHARARRPPVVLSRLLGRLRREAPPEPLAFLGLVAVALLLLLLGLSIAPRWVPPDLMVIPLLLGGLLLRRVPFLRLTGVVAAALLALYTVGRATHRPAGGLFVLLVAGLIAYEFSRSREETGLSGLRGDSVLVELRARLLMQGALPALPRGWRGEAVVKPAGGGPFAGDFVVSALTGDGECFELALVDVSGKGVDAGTRALLLSGALGGLLGSKASQDFLPAANAYLWRQEWEEGFATAVHVTVDLVAGSYVVESAGHPPAAHLDAGSGRWSLLDASGPALGLLPEVTYSACAGVLRPGDALLLYTDGLVELPGRDLSVGIDKLLGEAERLVTGGFEGGADLLIRRVADGSSDDRGLVLLWRTR